MTAFQAIDIGSSAQPPAGSTAWGIRSPVFAYTKLDGSVTNFNQLSPGTGDFCWEVWVSITNLNGQLFGFGNLPSSTFECHCQDNGGGTFQLTFNVNGNGPSTANNFTTSQYIGQGWMHVAFSRSGTTVSTWLNGQLASRLTGFTDSLDAAAAATIWIMGGPVGDRDQNYGYQTDGSWRNMRYVTGNSVYGTATSFNPPPVELNIPVITGTKFIWWVNSTSDFYAFGGPFSYGPWTPDYIADPNWLFTTGSGSSSSYFPYKIPYVFPGGDTAFPDGAGGTSVFQLGSFTNMGTAPNQPVVTGSGPAVPGIWANTIGDFTKTGTNVRIYNSTAETLSPGAFSFTYILYFYVPDNITNECKNLLVTEATNGLVMNIGRTGYGLDWLSFETYEGVEKAYGPHVWARNAWNYLVVQRHVGTYDGTPQLAAWGGWAGLSNVPKIPLVDNGLSTYAFAGGVQPFSIGCKAGSNVSCQMYLGEVWTWLNTEFTPFYDFTSPYISQQVVAPFPNYSNAALAIIFNGTPGDTTFTQVP